MNNKGVFDVNASSLVDLKAELFRKQEEFKQQKHLNENKTITRPKKIIKKPSIWSIKNKGLENRLRNDINNHSDKTESDKLNHSKEALEMKAKIYDKLMKNEINNIPETIDTGNYLVDFDEKRLIHKHCNYTKSKYKNNYFENEKRFKELQEIEEEKIQLQKPVEPPLTTDDEWVDFEDSFGRSRRCLKKDLPYMLSLTKEITSKNKKVAAVETIKNIDTEDLHDLSVDFKKQEPLHYEDILDNEIRTHGIGYFKFSADEKNRAEELDKLNNIRTETNRIRDRKLKIKEKQIEQRNSRLEKVRINKWLKEGKTDAEIEKLLLEIKAEKQAELIEKHEKEFVEPIIREESWRKYAPKREWDKGKSVFGGCAKSKSDFHNLQEFAPPSCYEEKRMKRYEKYYKPNQNNDNIEKPVSYDEHSHDVTTDNSFDFIDEELNRIRRASSVDSTHQHKTTNN